MFHENFNGWIAMVDVFRIEKSYLWDFFLKKNFETTRWRTNGRDAHSEQVRRNDNNNEGKKRHEKSPTKSLRSFWLDSLIHISSKKVVHHSSSRHKKNALQ